MKKALCLAVLFTLAFAGAAYAQDSLPSTASEGLQYIEEFLALLAGLVATRLTTGLKKMWWLSDEQRSKIIGLGADAVAAALALATAFALSHGAIAAGFLDENGLWQVLLLVWPAAKGWYLGEKTVRSLGG